MFKQYHIQTTLIFCVCLTFLVIWTQKRIIPKMDMLLSSRKIHFIETFRRDNFTFKQLCVIESAAKHHPYHLIQVFIASTQLQNDQLFKLIQEHYGNISGRNLNVEEFIENSKLRNLWKEIQSSKYFFANNMNNIICLLILKKLGGTYLDLDTLVLQALPSSSNFIGLQDEETISNSSVYLET